MFHVEKCEKRTLQLEEADEVFEVLASGTRRQILERLTESPATISEVAGELDTSMQNVSYHVEQLERAGLVEVVGRRYSSKARDMDLYTSKIGSLLIQFDTLEEEEIGSTRNGNCGDSSLELVDSPWS